MNKNTWILVADSANAKIYSSFRLKLLQPEASENDLRLIKHVTNPESRKKDSDLTSDNLGRHRSTNYGSDTFEPANSPKKIEEDRFALKLIEELTNGYHHKNFGELILVSSPSFLGMLNKHIAKSNGLRETVVVTIEKDYIDLNEKELVKHLRSHL